MRVKLPRREYQKRRDVFCAALAERLDGIVSFDVRSGGLALWTKTSPLIDPERWRGTADDDRQRFLRLRAKAPVSSTPAVCDGLPLVPQACLSVAIHSLSDHS